MTHASAVIDQRPAHDSKPAVTYRHAGDRYLMVEYGEMVLDMTLNFFCLLYTSPSPRDS